MPSKATVRRLLETADYSAVAELAAHRRRIFGALVSLTYDADPDVAWRAVEALGVAAARVAPQDPAAVREVLRRLFWLIQEESGGICWRAPEAMAEIVHRCPEAFADYVPIIVSLLAEMAEEDLHHFRAGVLWAIGRLGPVARPHVDRALPGIAAALEHRDPQVRGMAVWCLIQIGHGDRVAQRPALRSDEELVDFYDGGTLRRVTIRTLAAPAGTTGDG